MQQIKHKKSGRRMRPNAAQDGTRSSAARERSVERRTQRQLKRKAI